MFVAGLPPRPPEAHLLSFARAAFALGGVAFVAVAADHRVGLVDQPLALGDAGAQLLLIVLELLGLALTPGGAVLFVGDEEFLPSPLNIRPLLLIQVISRRRD